MIIQATPTNKSNNLDVTDREVIFSNRYIVSQASMNMKDKQSEYEALKQLTQQLKSQLENSESGGTDRDKQITILQEILNALQGKDESVIHPTTP